MTHKSNPRPLAGGAGEQDVDLAGERVRPDYLSESRTTKANFLRSELVGLRARYERGVVPPAIREAIRRLETDIAWSEHREVRL